MPEAPRQPKCSRRRRVWGTALVPTDAGHQLPRLTRRQRLQGLQRGISSTVAYAAHARWSGAARGHRLLLRRSPPPCRERRSDLHDWISMSVLSTSQSRARAAALMPARVPNVGAVGSAACPVRPATCRRAAAAHRPLEGRPLPSQCVSAAAVRQHGRTRGFAVPDAWWSLAYGGWLVPDRSYSA